MQIKLPPSDSRKIIPNSEAKEHGKLKHKEEGELRKVAQEFESVFLNIVLQSMRKSVNKSELMNGGNAEDMYQSMLDSEYASTMSKLDQTGLAKIIEDQLSSASKNKGSVKDLQQRIGMEKYENSKLDANIHLSKLSPSINK